LPVLTIFKVLLPQNETLATPLANAQLIYMNKFLCILDSTLTLNPVGLYHKIIESLINANRKTAKIIVKKLQFIHMLTRQTIAVRTSKTAKIKK